MDPDPDPGGPKTYGSDTAFFCFKGWPLIITVIGALRPQHSEAVVRTAFQALQLVLTDFLPLIPHHCLPLGTGALFTSCLKVLSSEMDPAEIRLIR